MDGCQLCQSAPGKTLSLLGSHFSINVMTRISHPCRLIKKTTTYEIIRYQEPMATRTGCGGIFPWGQIHRSSLGLVSSGCTCKQPVLESPAPTDSKYPQYCSSDPSTHAVPLNSAQTPSYPPHNKPARLCPTLLLPTLLLESRGALPVPSALCPCRVGITPRAEPVEPPRCHFTPQKGPDRNKRAQTSFPKINQML